MTTGPPSVLLQLLSHPTRRAILQTLIEGGGPCSPREMSRALGEPLSNVGYHVHKLADTEALALSGTESGGSSIKHFYVLGPLVEDHRPVVDAVLAAE